MAKLWYEPKAGGTELHGWNDPQVLEKDSIVADLATFQLFRALDDNARTYLAIGGIPGAGISGGWPNLESFDEYLDDEIDRFADLLDVFDYDSRVENLTVRDGDWFVPVAVESASAEEAGAAALAIDGDNGTWWQTDTPPASIVLRVRDYRKMITGLRLRTTAGDLRAQLQGVDVSASGGLGMIDDPGNILEAGIDFTYGGDAWMEHTLLAKKRARYVKLAIAGSLNGNNHIRIREIQIRVGITNHDK